jgi:Secretion system C-terminal sorting domain/Ig-like domain CHU_C associated
MKKINRCLLISLSITFYTINSNVAYCQTCNSSVQQIYLAEKVCVNNPSSLQLDISLNYYNSTDKYGWSDYGYQLSDVTVKRPDGTTAIVLSYGNLTFPSSDACYYIFPGGYFNVVGDWKFCYVQADLCSGDEYYNEVTLKVVGLTSNTIGSDEVICNVGGTPQNISNTSIGSNSAYTNKWQNKTGASSWYDISGATSISYQPSYINQTTMYRRIVTTNELGCTDISNNVSKYVFASLTPGAIGSNQDVCYNVSPSIISETTAPTGGSSYPNYSYQWYISYDNTNWSAISGATAKNYQPSFTLGYTYFKRKTIDASCGELYTNSVQLHGYNDLTPGSIGSDQLICYGANPSIISVTSIETGGIGSNSYQWYSSPDASNWSVASGSSTGQNYQPPALTAKTYYRKAIINSCRTAYTNTVIIDVRPVLSNGSIGSDQTICYGVAPSLVATLVNPSGASNSFTYSWESSLNNSTWNVITGANLVSYQPPALNQTTYFRKQIIDANCPPAYTNTVTVTVRPVFSIGSIGLNQNICNGTTPVMLSNVAEPSGGQGPYTYIWETSLNSIDWSIITGVNSPTYQPGSLGVTTYYRRKVTDASCGNGYNNTVTVTVKPVFSVGTIGSNQTICINTIPSLISSTASPSGGQGGYSYFWESSLNGTDFNSISGAFAETYQPGSLSQTTYYRRNVTDASCGNGYTNTVKITVRSDFFYGTIGSNQTIFYSAAPYLISPSVPSSGGSGSYIYQWQKSENGTDWYIIPGATLSEYQPGSLTATTKYRILVTDASCSSSSGYTNTVTITVTYQLLPGSIAADQTICFRTPPGAIIGSSPSGGSGLFSFQWMKSLNNTDWSNIEGEVGSFLQPGALTEDTYFRRKVTSGNSTSFSNSVKITVYQPLIIPVTDVKSFYCKGSSIQLSVINPTYFSYKWYDNSQTYLQDGTKMNVANLTSDKKYYLKALNSQGCFSDPAEISLTVDNVHAGFTHDISTVALGNAVKFTSTSINASSVAWNFFEGDIIHETNPVHYYNTLGGTNSKKFDVKLNVISPGGCLDSLLLSDVITVFNDITGIETSKSVTFSYYPNPVTEKLYLSSSERIRTIKVFTINGNLIESLAFNEESVSIDFNQFKSGIYFLEVNGAQETKKNIKIIKQ